MQIQAKEYFKKKVLYVNCIEDFDLCVFLLVMRNVKTSV
jgi:hypothetical protein